MNIETVPIASISKNGLNPRSIKDASFKKLVASVKSFPEMLLLRPVVVDADGVILGGNMRYEACLSAGHKEIPIIRAADLTEEQRREFIIKDNVSGGDWDWDMLANEWDVDLLGEWGLDLPVGLGDAPTEGLTDEDAAPEVPADPVTRMGDLWLLGRHRLLCGDSTSIDAVDKLMAGQKADMVFTDPPYGVDYDGGHAVKGARREKIKNDATPDIYDGVMPVAYYISKDCAATYLWFSDSKSAAVSAAVSAAGYEVRNTLIWNKNVAQFGAIGAQYKSKHEPCLYCFKKGHAPYWAGPNNEVSVWDINRSAKNEFHPTQKPVALAERAMGNSSKSGDTVIDLFGGSGSTLIACEKTTRDCRMMELDPKYCDVIIKRWQEYTGQAAALEVDGRTFEEVTSAG